jgi:hypothetical protein
MIQMSREIWHDTHVRLLLLEASSFSHLAFGHDAVSLERLAQVCKSFQA